MPCNNPSVHSSTASGGDDVAHAIFVVAVQVDVYQPKYANIPMTWTVQAPPPGTLGVLWNKYGECEHLCPTTMRGSTYMVRLSRFSGVGTKFGAQHEGNTIIAMNYPSSLQMDCGNGVSMTYSFQPVPGQGTKFTVH